MLVGGWRAGLAQLGVGVAEDGENLVVAVLEMVEVAAGKALWVTEDILAESRA